MSTYHRPPGYHWFDFSWCVGAVAGRVVASSKTWIAHCSELELHSIPAIVMIPAGCLVVLPKYYCIRVKSSLLSLSSPLASHALVYLLFIFMAPVHTTGGEDIIGAIILIEIVMFVWNFVHNLCIGVGNLCIAV